MNEEIKTEERVPECWFDWPEDLPWPLPAGWAAGSAGALDD